MANPIISGLESGLGIDTTAGTQQLQQALQALQAVGVPTAQQLDLPTLQKYVQAGVLTPQQYQAIQANPQVYSQMIQSTQDNSGMAAQKQALQQLGGIVQNGGSTPINQANLINNINTTNQAMQAARQGITENAQERGVAGGGQEFLDKLLNEQGNASNANAGAVNSAANNAQLALQAMTQGGQLGTALQGQSQQSAQAQAEAAKQIAEYNSQLQSTANQYNTQNANQAQQMNLANAQNISGANTGLLNQATEYNAKVPQTIYADQLEKAKAEAQQYGNQSNLSQQQAQNQNSFTGNLLGMGAELGSAYMTGGASLAAPAADTSGMASGNYQPQTTAAGYSANSAANNPNWQGTTYPGYAFGGETNPEHETVKSMENNPSAGFSQGGMCYAKGGEAHSHEICMKMGGKVPGTPKVPGAIDTTKNDTIPARLSPHEIVLPNSITQSPNPAGNAAKFVSQIKGQPAQMPQGNGKSFADVIKELEANGLELRIGSK